MAMSVADQRQAAREIARRIFQEPNATAIMSLEHLRAAVGTIDAVMDALPATLNQTQSIKVNIALALPEPFKSIATTQQKAVALMAWAMKETGII